MGRTRFMRWTLAVVLATAALFHVVAGRPADETSDGRRSTSAPGEPAKPAEIGFTFTERMEPDGVAFSDTSGVPGLAGRPKDMTPGTLRMRVVHRGDASPLAGARVVVSTRGRADLVADSDASGAVEFQGVSPSAPYDVAVERPPFAPWVFRGARVEARGVLHLGDVALGLGYAIRGTVIGPDGRGLPGADILAFAAHRVGLAQGLDEMRLAGFISSPLPLAATTSDTQGRFLLQELPPGRYDVRGAHSDHAPGTVFDVGVSPTSPLQDIRVVLTAGGGIHGLVVRADGNLSRGARIRAFPEDAELRPGDGVIPVDGAVDGRGRFRLRGLRRGQAYRLGVLEEGRAPFLAAEAVWVTGDVEQDLVVPVLGRVEGVVRRRGSDAPVAGALVTLSAYAGEEPRSPGILPSRVVTIASARTDGAGVFQLDGIPAGQVGGVARVPGCQPATRVRGGDLIWGTVLEGETLRVEIDAAPGATVAGVVRTFVGGAGVPDARVVLYARRPDPREQNRVGVPCAVTDALGAFRIEGLAPDEYFVVAQSAQAASPGWRGGAPLVDVRNSASEEHVEVLVTPMAWITGRILDASDGPVAGAEVVALSTAEHAEDLGLVSSGFAPPPSARTDGAGRFVLGGLPPRSRCLLSVHATGFVTGYHDERVAASADEPRNVVVRLRPAARLAGRVTDEEGRPVAGAGVTARCTSEPSDGAQASRNYTDLLSVRGRTDAEGRFRLQGLPAGRVDLQFVHPGFASPEASRHHVGEGQVIENLDVVLAPARSITGNVVDGDGEPVSGALLAALVPNDATDGVALEALSTATIQGHVAQSDAEGRFVISRLADRSYLVVVLGTGPVEPAPEGSRLWPARRLARPGDAIRLEVRRGPSRDR